MTELPAPTTLSPGKLELLYTAGLLPHKVGTNFNETVTITDVSTIRTEAIALAAVVGPCVPSTVVINSWRITNPSGVSLYEEAFATPIVGSYTLPTDAIQSESATFSLTGKGAPDVGLKQGQIRYELFGNYYDPLIWTYPTAAVSTHTGLAALRTFLNSSTVTGCDFYGSPGVWRNYYTTQINAHYQKKYGI
jgi:hypothetical protein